MSTLKIDTLEDLSAAQTVDAAYIVHGTAKAWCSFNGTGTIAINNSLNVTSLTDRGTGSYTVNLTNAMTDALYSVTGGGNVAPYAGNYGRSTTVAPNDVSSYYANTALFSTPTLVDFDISCASVEGDLA